MGNNVHIMPDSVYSYDFWNKINDVYSEKEHYFYLYDYNGKRKYAVNGSLIEISKMDIENIFFLLKKIVHSKTVILHSLYLPPSLLIIMAIISPFIKKRLMWYIWSADLYNELENENRISGLMIKKRLKRFFRKKLIKNIAYSIVVAKGDYIALKDGYNTRAKMIIAKYWYDINQYNIEDTGDKHCIILVNHSASNKLLHKKVFEIIKKSEYTEGCNIVSILSYPDNPGYVKFVKQIGERFFSERFKAVEDWMPKEDYYKLINSIYAMVIGCDVQGGAGAIYNGILSGKKVYVSTQNPIYEDLKENGIMIYTLEDLLDESFLVPLTKEEIESNRTILMNMLSEESFKASWNKVFCG